MIEEKILKKLIERGIVSLGEVASLTEEQLMNTILDKVHPYSISQLSSGDWITWVKDTTRPEGRRKLKRKKKSDLFNCLVEFYGITPEKEILFEELFAEWVEYKKNFVGTKKKSISQSTIKRYQKDYSNYIEKSLLAKESITKISTTKLEQYIFEIITKHEMLESCAKNIIGYIQNAFQYARRSKYITEDPAEFIDKDLLISKCSEGEEKPDTDRILTESETSALKLALYAHESKYPYYMPSYATELALLTGMRVGELSALKWENISKDFIYVRLSEHRIDYIDRPCEYYIGLPKNNKVRQIPMSEEIQELFDRIKSLGIKSEWAFARKNGERFTAHDISCATDRRATSAGIKKTSIHGIRRTVSSNLNKILPRTAVASMLGHLETTNERFYDYDTTEVKAKADALHQMSQKYPKVPKIVEFPSNKKIAEAL